MIFVLAIAKNITKYFSIVIDILKSNLIYTYTFLARTPRISEEGPTQHLEEVSFD